MQLFGKFCVKIITTLKDRRVETKTMMLTITEAARELQVTINTVYARINDGTLPAMINPAVKSRRYSVRREDVDRLRRTRYQPAAASARDQRVKTRG